mgnify:CR=1 FL=1|jgi:nicotinamide mononucleotide adenylyltransferase|tara:strand:+ start:7295 stop:7702 length:408 start_codon:yes stop_codon:yes gene_type:complete
MFDYKKPSVQMLGRWQPWHDGHTELFKQAYSITGQVVIMIRDVYQYEGDAGSGRTRLQDDNPFGIIDVISNIENRLEQHGFRNGYEYLILEVPNIVDISYGRDVGYTFTEHDLGEETHDISATKIREEMRKKGIL